MRSARAAVSLLVGLGAAGCAPQSPRDRGHVAAELVARTGHGLRPATDGKSKSPPGISVADGLSEDEAVAVALWNSPTFQGDLAALGVARADLVDAGMIRNPLLTLLLPLGPKQLELTATLPLESLWQRPRRVAAAEREVERVAASLVQTGLDVVRDVKRAHAEVVLADARGRIARESVALRGRIAEIAEARLRAGDLSQLEATAVRLDVRRAEEDVIRYDMEARAARDRLASLLGWGVDGPGVAVAAAPPEARAVGDAAAAVKQALALRPDLRAAELAIESLGARRGWERSKIVPAVAGLFDANGAGKEGFEAGPGLAIELPFFNQNRGGVLRAEAEMERAIWQYAAVQQKIALEVRDAILKYQLATQALERLRRDVLPPLDENVRRAEAAYKVGDVAHLFVLETMRQRLDAGLREIELEAELRRSAAELDRSLGRKHVAR